MPELVLALVRIGIVVLLWLFVLAAVRVIRTDIYGSRAGRPVRRPTPERAAKPARQPKARRRDTPGHLVVLEGALAGTSIALRDTPVTIGRANDCTLVIADDYASNKHARLVPRDDAWFVEDLGSTNGTYLDRSKVTGLTPVQMGVPIRIGKTVLELRR